jgi:VanZ family protein
MDSYLRRSLISAWLPVFAWLAIIALESSAMLSSANTNGFLHRVLTLAFGPLDKHSIDVVNAVLRKTGHFVGYATLSLLFFRAVVKSAPVLGLHRLYFRWLALWSVLFTICVAAADEYHQAHLPSRTGAFHDVIIDAAGAIFVQFLLIALIKKRTPLLRRAAALSDNMAAVLKVDDECAVCPTPPTQAKR